MMSYVANFFAALFFLVCFFPSIVFAEIVESTRFYGGEVSIEIAEVAAKLEVELKALSVAMHDLTQLPEVQFIAKEPGVVRPPDLSGITRMLFSIHFVNKKIAGDTKKIYVWGEAIPKNNNLRKQILEALRQPDIVERYRAILDTQSILLKTLDDSMTTSRKGSVTSERLKELEVTVNKIKAMNLYLEILPQYYGVWPGPKDLEEKIKSALSYDPENPLLLGAYAEMLIRNDNPSKALNMITRALDQEKKLAYLYNIEGVILLRQRLPLLATDAFRKAIEKAPESSMYFANRAAVSFIRDDTDSMCKDFFSACALGDCSGLRWAKSQNFCNNFSNQKSDFLPEPVVKTVMPKKEKKIKIRAPKAKALPIIISNDSFLSNTRKSEVISRKKYRPTLENNSSSKVTPEKFVKLLQERKQTNGPDSSISSVLFSPHEEKKSINEKKNQRKN